MDLRRHDNETLASYIWRIGQAKDNGLADLTWDDIATVANPQFFDDESNYLGSCAYRKRYATAKEFYDGVFRDMNAEHEESEALREMKKERAKLQTEKLEYNKWLRENARDELIFEKISECINNLPLLDLPDSIDVEIGEREYLLAFGDTHYGAEFEINGLIGDVLNAYSPEIFEERMWKLRDYVIDTIYANEVEKLSCVFLGDAIDSIIRVSQLMKLRYGIIESTIRFSDFLANWINELSKIVKIVFYYTVGNHGELRMLGQPKGTFTDDNVEKIIIHYLKIRLQGNPNVQIVENSSGYIFDNICGSNVLCIHGEVKNMQKAIDDFTRIYNTKIDYLIAGHMHHSATKEVGVDSEVINVPSIVGTDPYALSLGYHTNAGAKMFVFEDGKGITTTFSYKL